MPTICVGISLLVRKVFGDTSKPTGNPTLFLCAALSGGSDLDMMI